MNKEIIDKTIAALRHNHFEVFFAHNTAEASAIFFRDIFPGLQVETVSCGDSETMKATGVLNELRKRIIELSKAIIGDTLYKEDFVFTSAMDRSVVLLDGISEMIKNRNLACGGILYVRR